jgi:DNA-binding CsgD family transcriptional regulator
VPVRQDSELEQLLLSLRAIYGARSVDDFANRTIRELLRLVPSDIAAYKEVDLAHGNRASTWTLPDARTSTLDSAFDDQIVVSLKPAPFIAAASVSRGGRQYTERERALVALLRPHLVAAHDNVIALARAQARTERLRRQLGNEVLVLDERGAVCSATATAVDRIRRFFKGAPLPPSYLPAELVLWLRQQRCRLSSDEPVRPLGPLTVTGPDGTLTVRSVFDPPEIVLVLDEQPAALLEFVARLPLSSREKQILVAAGEGKSNAAIAAALELSPATVKKHLEHIYEKLGVSGRVAAVVRALATRMANVLALTCATDVFSNGFGQALRNLSA